MAVGCRPPIISIPPSGARPSLVYSDVTYPNVIEERSFEVIPYDSSRIELTNRLTTERTSAGLSGRAPATGSATLFGLEDSDYGSALRKLRDEYKVEGLLNTTVDTRRFVLNLFFVRFSAWETRVSGVGWRFKPGEGYHPDKTDPIEYYKDYWR